MKIFVGPGFDNLLGFMEVLLKTDRQIKNSQLEPKQVEP